LEEAGKRIADRAARGQGGEPGSVLIGLSPIELEYEQNKRNE
jgi:hypothetical protein